MIIIMNIITRIAIILSLIFASIVFALPAFSSGFSDLKFNNIEIYRVENGTARLKWTTNEATKATVYFGEKTDKLDRQIGYGSYDYYHETVLAGLKRNNTYFYKIVVIDAYGRQNESFPQSFSTKGMKKEESVAPIISEYNVLQVINKSMALFWITNEETSAIVYYRASNEKSARKVGLQDFELHHEIIINGLKPGTKYNIKIVAEDRSENQSNISFSLYTQNYKEDIDLAISNIAPLGFDKELISPRSAIIKWRTNLVSKSYINFGEKSGKYDRKVDVSIFHTLDHRIKLYNLKPNTVYYYKIIAFDSFNGKKTTTKEMTFATSDVEKKISNGSLVKGSGYKIYVIIGNNKLWIQSADVFSKLGYKWSWVERVDDNLLNQYVEGKAISSAKVHPDGTLIKYPKSDMVYILEKNMKRPISSPEDFANRGFSWEKIITISNKEKYKTGEYM